MTVIMINIIKKLELRKHSIVIPDDFLVIILAQGEGEFIYLIKGYNICMRHRNRHSLISRIVHTRKIFVQYKPFSQNMLQKQNHS